MHSAGSSARMYERTHSVQPFNCALRSFAQACLQRMKQQLYWVKVRRILRQVAQACTDSLDRLFHTSDLVERDIVDHHNVPALERWDQTLLYVRQEGLSIHGSFDQHRSHDAGLTQPSDKRHRLPVSHRGIADQALAAWVPTVEPQHVSGDCRLVDKYEVGRIKKALLPNVGVRVRRRRASALPPADFFLMVMPWRAKNRESALRLPGHRRLCSAETISFSRRCD